MEKSFREMDVVERVKAICKEKGISLAQLERGCGFANAYIAGLRKGSMPADRLQKVAEYLDVSYWFLLTGQEDDSYMSVETAEMARNIHNNKELRLLFKAVKGISPSQMRLLHDIAISWKSENDG